MAKILAAIARSPLLSMLRFSQPQSSRLAVCSLPSHPAAEGELPRLRLGSQLWWRPHPCRGPYFLAWVSALLQGQSHPLLPHNALCTHPALPHPQPCVLILLFPWSPPHRCLLACQSPCAVRACALHHAAPSSPPHYSETPMHTRAS